MNQPHARYDIGGGIIIDDYRYHLRAEKTDPGVHSSMGISRPTPVTDEIDTVWSLCGNHFYLCGFAKPITGFWLGAEKYESREEATGKMGQGIFGKACAEFVVDGVTYWRQVHHFNNWEFKSSRGPASLSKDDELARDYLSLVQDDMRQVESKFNEFIAPSGKTLKDILDAIGYAVPSAPAEVPVVPLPQSIAEIEVPS